MSDEFDLLFDVGPECRYPAFDAEGRASKVAAMATKAADLSAPWSAARAREGLIADLSTMSQRQLILVKQQLDTFVQKAQPHLRELDERLTQMEPANRGHNGTREYMSLLREDKALKELPQITLDYRGTEIIGFHVQAGSTGVASGELHPRPETCTSPKT